MYIGMDVGGTTARIRLTDAQGSVLWEAEDQGGTLAGIGREELTVRLGRIIRRALEASGTTPEDCDQLCIGASGVDTEDAQAVYEEILLELGFSREHLMVVNDAELLMLEGVTQIEISPHCTCCEPEKFWSYRRCKDSTRMLAFIEKRME